MRNNVIPFPFHRLPADADPANAPAVLDEYGFVDCTGCARIACPIRDTFPAQPISAGGLGLCPRLPDPGDGAETVPAQGSDAAPVQQEDGGSVVRLPHYVRDLTLQDLAARARHERQLAQPTPNADGVHVGDLFVCSWGYDMTIVDFFEVVDLRGKHTAMIRKISGEPSDGDGLTGHVRPCRGHYTDDATQARTRRGHDGGPEVYNRRDQSWMRITTDDKRHAYDRLD